MRTYSGTAFLRESKERPGGAAPHGRAFSLTVLYKSVFSIYNIPVSPGAVHRKPGEKKNFDGRAICLRTPEGGPG